MPQYVDAASPHGNIGLRKLVSFYHYVRVRTTLTCAVTRAQGHGPVAGERILWLQPTVL